MIILTGGAGFIGSVLLRYLNSSGYKDIIVVDNLRDSSKWKNLLCKQFRDYWPREKLLHELRANNLPKELDAIIHLGACSSTTETNVDYLMENNYRYTLELAEYCVNNQKKFIYASSAATYGDGNLGFSDTSDINQLKPLNAYGYSKQLFDLKAIQSGLLNKIVGIKFFNVFGPNEYHKGSMQSMILRGFEQVKANAKIKLFKSNTPQYSDGGQVRDFIYVKDCCKALLWFLEKSHAAGLFNLGTGNARSWNDLANAIFNSLKITPNIEYIEMPASLSKQYQNFTQAEMNKLLDYGYKEPFMSLEESVDDYVSDYLSQDFAHF